MSETQRCYVCGQWDLLTDSRVVVKPGDKYFDRVVAQCPRCFRFICSDHGERLDLSGRKSWLSFGRAKDADLTICCPFDPGVPLGDQSF